MVVAILCLSQGHGGLELYALNEHKELTARGIECIAVVAKNSMLATQLEELKLNPIYLGTTNRRLPIFAATDNKSHLNPPPWPPTSQSQNG